MNMPSRNIFSHCILALGLLSSIAGAAADEITLENVVAPGANRSDEPIAKEASLEKAAHFLDSAALTWQKDRKCFTCHTNFAYLYARPAISADNTAHSQGVQFRFA